MPRAYNTRVIDDLRQRIAHLEGAASRKAVVLPFGIPEMDERLPGGGLSFGAIHEIAGGGAGTVDGAAAALFAGGIAARAKGKVLWCLTRPDLFGPALSQAGLHPDRVMAKAMNGAIAIATKYAQAPWPARDEGVVKEQDDADLALNKLFAAAHGLGPM